MQNRSVWYEWEQVAKNHYENNWYLLVDQNFATNTWEIDLILQKNNTLVFVEVKIVDWIDDLHDYITKKKLKYLEKTIQYYLQKHYHQGEIRLDVVFVKKWKVFDIYDWIELT